MRRPLLGVLALAIVGCGSGDGASPQLAMAPGGTDREVAGVGRMTPGPGNATADQRLGSKLGGR